MPTWNVLADTYLRPQYYPHLERFDDPAVRVAACLAVRNDHRHHLLGARGALGDLAWVTATIECGGHDVQIAGTHLAWSDRPAFQHVGLAQLRTLTDTLGPDAVVCGDLNDTDSGPAIDHLDANGWRRNPRRGPTAVVNGVETATIDWVTARGAVTPLDVRLHHHTDTPLPNAEFPSDHVPLSVTVAVGHRAAQ